MIGIDFIGYLIFCTIVEIFYFKIARNNNITDQPNCRSSHSVTTIRGGGIIFPIAFWGSFYFIQVRDWMYFATGLAAISIISFLDDILTLSNKVRLVVHFFSVAMIFFQLHMVWNFILIIPLFIIVTGVINAYNFMDGINGLTALYSIITVVSLYYVNQFLHQFLPTPFFLSVLASLVVFSFYNVRKKAKCFAGDVGSVCMAFLICFFILTLSLATGSLLWVLFLTVYGIDVGFTIFSRICRKESIFKAHRSHFYQFLANERKISHIKISFIYSGAQLLFNYIVIINYEKGSFMLVMLILFAFLLIYITFRLRFEGRYRLFTAY